MGNAWVVWRMDWEESERGWGVRPDGYSLHLTPEAWTKFYAEFVRKERERNPSGIVPDEYSRPCSDNPRLVEVIKKVYDEVHVASTKHGKWYL